MRKVLVIIMLFSLLAVSFSAVSAQADSQQMAGCTTDELNTTVQFLGDVDSSVGQLGQRYNLSGDPKDPAYGKTIVALDAVAYTYWSKDYPQLPNCDEAQTLGYLLGSIYDQSLMAGLLHNAASWSATSGDADGATAFEKQAKLRETMVSQTQQAIQNESLSDLAAEMNPEKLASCSQDQITALTTNFGDAFTQIGSALTDLSNQPATAFAVTEGASYAFATDGFSTVSTCKEDAELAYVIMGSLDDINIIAGLTANAAWESAAGNTDVAQAMTDSANQRLSDFNATWDTLSAQFGMQATATPEATSGS